jgi:hypothetical protein
MDDSEEDRENTDEQRDAIAKRLLDRPLLAIDPFGFLNGFVDQLLGIRRFHLCAPFSSFTLPCFGPPVK